MVKDNFTCHLFIIIVLICILILIIIIIIFISVNISIFSHPPMKRLLKNLINSESIHNLSSDISYRTYCIIIIFCLSSSFFITNYHLSSSTWAHNLLLSYGPFYWKVGVKILEIMISLSSSSQHFQLNWIKNRFYVIKLSLFFFIFWSFSSFGHHHHHHHLIKWTRCKLKDCNVPIIFVFYPGKREER